MFANSSPRRVYIRVRNVRHVVCSNTLAFFYSLCFAFSLAFLVVVNGLSHFIFIFNLCFYLCLLRINTFLNFTVSIPAGFSKRSNLVTNNVDASTCSYSLDTCKPGVVFRFNSQSFGYPGSHPGGVVVDKISKVFTLRASRHKVSNSTFCSNLTVFKDFRVNKLQSTGGFSSNAKGSSCYTTNTTSSEGQETKLSESSGKLTQASLVFRYPRIGHIKPASIASFIVFIKRVLCFVDRTTKQLVHTRLKGISCQFSKTANAFNSVSGSTSKSST